METYDRLLAQQYIEKLIDSNMNIVAMEIFQQLNSLKYNQNSIDTNNIYNDHYSQEYNPHFSYFTNKDDDA